MTERTPSPVLDAVVRVALEATGATRGRLVAVDPVGDGLEVVAVHGGDDAWRATTPDPATLGAVGYVIATGQPQILSRPDAGPSGPSGPVGHIPGAAGPGDRMPGPAGHGGLMPGPAGPGGRGPAPAGPGGDQPGPPSSALCAPCICRDEVVGALELVDKANGAGFSFDDLELAGLLAGVAGEAIVARRTPPAIDPGQLIGDLGRLAAADPGRYATVARLVQSLLHG